MNDAMNDAGKDVAYGSAQPAPSDHRPGMNQECAAATGVVADDHGEPTVLRPGPQRGLAQPGMTGHGHGRPPLLPRPWRSARWPRGCGMGCLIWRRRR